MTESEARALRSELEILVPSLWVGGLRVVNGTKWQIEARDERAPGRPWVIVGSRAQAIRRWPELNAKGLARDGEAATGHA